MWYQYRYRTGIFLVNLIFLALVRIRIFHADPSDFLYCGFVRIRIRNIADVLVPGIYTDLRVLQVNFFFTSPLQSEELVDQLYRDGYTIHIEAFRDHSTIHSLQYLLLQDQILYPSEKCENTSIYPTTLKIRNRVWLVRSGQKWTSLKMKVTLEKTRKIVKIQCLA